MKQPKNLFLILLSLTLYTCLPSQNKREAEVHRIAFGSCNREHLPQPLWQPILEDEPDLWIWLGDNIYGDTHDMQVMRDKYELQYHHPDYSRLRESTAVIGIWDDHDYGINDGGVNYSKKAESQQLMLDFLDEPENSPRRQQEGAYASYTYGPTDKQVKVYLLDARYHRDTIEMIDRIYQPNLDGTILGEEQWKWLKEEMENSEAAINIIASGIQFLPEEHGSEKWANFPNERKRLLELIAENDLSGAVLLSGDRHMAEVSKAPLPGGNPIYEVTASGLTHTWAEYREEPNRYRQGEMVIALHYGLLDIKWDEKIMVFQIKGEKGEELLRQEVKF